MKSVLTKLALVSAAFYLSSGTAYANICGFGNYPPCDVPEPSSAYLFLGAAGVAALVVKLRRKK